MALWPGMVALVLVKEKSVMVVDYERYSSSSTFPDTPPSSSSFARCCLSVQAVGALTKPGDFPQMAHRGLNVVAQGITI
jgi:hypothetical protein